MLQFPSQADLRSTFQEILAAPEFASVGDSPLTRVLQAILGWIADIWNFLFPNEVLVGPVEWIARGVALLAIVTLVAVIVRGLRGRRPAARRGPGGVAPPPTPQDPTSWIRWARARSDEGRFREAATGLYQAALLRLDEKGVLVYREWKTPGDYADEVPGQDPTGRGFLGFLRTFLSVAFGAGQATAESVEHLERFVLDLGVRR